VRPEINAWQTFAQERGYRFTAPAGDPSDHLAIDARIGGTAIEIRTSAQRKGGSETRARADARHAMLGRVAIRSARPLDGMIGVFLGRSRTGHADLDAKLSTFTSSAALLATILDPLTVEVLRLLGGKPRFALVYENGAITLRWACVEIVPAPLDAALRLAAHLAVAGSEISPYR